MKSDESLNFTSASALPVKIFKDMELLRSLNDEHKIFPLHVQLCPTNACNLSCPFCSCRDRDKRLELSKQDVVDLVEVLKQVKTKAVTITGGGEPLLFKHIEYLIEMLVKSQIEIGITTNGILFNKISPEAIASCTWIRISVSDYSDFNYKFINSLDYAVNAVKNTDFGFSYIAMQSANISKLATTVEYANKNNFTHVRLANDITSSNKADLINIKLELTKRGIDDSLVIYQDREYSCNGQRSCLISLLKPMISADGLVYPCCGVQYAREDTAREFPQIYNMGGFRELPKIVEEQSYFNGSVCETCYYDTYNTYLKLLISDFKHLSFL